MSCAGFSREYAAPLLLRCGRTPDGPCAAAAVDVEGVMLPRNMPGPNGHGKMTSESRFLASSFLTEK
jgi:hypothetical protein